MLSFSIAMQERSRQAEGEEKEEEKKKIADNLSIFQ
jgi:hypothetical protein